MNEVQRSPSTTFLFNIESGYLESQTILAVECLRRFGGKFADAPVLAVTPRLGASLTRDTQRRLDELEVTYIKQNLGHPYSWYTYINKPLAAMLAEDSASTEQIIFLDSDTLVLAEPELLWLEHDIDFAICSTIKGMGSSGSRDKYEPFWLALCQHYGIDIDQLPWIVTGFDRERVRFRLHSGVFVFRRNLGLGQAWVKACEKMLASRISYRKQSFPGDDVALAFAVVELNLRWQLLPVSYNYQITPHSRTYQREQLKLAQILHYHHTLDKPDECTWALMEMEDQLPDIYNWIKNRVPLEKKVGGFQRMLFRRLLNQWRNLQRRQALAEIKVMVQ